MDALRYVPARIKSFLSKLYEGHYSDFENNPSYVERITRQCKRKNYECLLPINSNHLFEEVLKEGEVSDKERKIIEFVWLEEDIPIGIRLN